MRIELQPFVAATLALTLLAACGERGEKETTAATPAAEQDTAQTTQVSTEHGTTTTFGEPTPEPQAPAQ